MATIQSHLRKNWKIRWFILQGDMLFYFRDQEAETPLDFIPLCDCTITRTSKTNRPFVFELKQAYDKKRFEFGACDENELESWMKVIQEASEQETIKLQKGKEPIKIEKKPEEASDEDDVLDDFELPREWQSLGSLKNCSSPISRVDNLQYSSPHSSLTTIPPIYTSSAPSSLSDNNTPPIVQNSPLTLNPPTPTTPTTTATTTTTTPLRTSGAVSTQIALLNKSISQSIPNANEKKREYSKRFRDSRFFDKSEKIHEEKKENEKELVKEKSEKSISLRSRLWQ